MSVKNDSGKAKLSLVDPSFTEGMARVLEIGEKEYGPGNWRKPGLGYARVIDAMKRHTLAIERGEDIDPLSGEPHAYHIASNAMFLQYYNDNKQVELDDRHFKVRVPSMPRGTARKPIRTLASAQARFDLQEMQQRGPKRGPQNPEGKEYGQGILDALGWLLESKGGQAVSGDPLQVLQIRVTSWANKVYPNRTTEVAFAKMVGEVAEIMADPSDALEWADVLILLVDAAHLRGIDIIEAAHEKMNINEGRAWKIDKRTGIMSHVKGAADV